MKHLLSVLSLFISSIFFGQNIEANYFPIQGYHVFDSIVQSYANTYQNPSYKHSIDNKKGIQKFNEICEERAEYFSFLARNKEIMNGDEITEFLQLIVDDLVGANPELKPLKPKVFTLRTAQINASNFGEGVILFNLGLLDRLSSIDEVAFVLSHELAHEYFKHVYKSVESIALLMTDQDLQDKLKEASEKEYGANRETSKIILTLLSTRSLHGRGNEFASDSLGLCFMDKAGYEKKGALDALAVLRDSDYIKYNREIDIKDFIHTDAYPFKEDWLSQEGNISAWEAMDSLYVMPDSLRSHPDCELRISKINSYTYQNLNLPKDSLKILFTNHIKPILDFEVIQLLMDKEQYSLALYYAMQLSQTYGVNLYLKSVILDCYASIYSALKLSKFSYSVDFPGAMWPKSYNELLFFLHNMSSKKLAKIFTNNYQSRLHKYSADGYVNYLSVVNETILMQELTKDDLEENYKKVYGENLYYKRLSIYLINKSKE